MSGSHTCPHLEDSPPSHAMYKGDSRHLCRQFLTSASTVWMGCTASTLTTTSIFLLNALFAHRSGLWRPSNKDWFSLDLLSASPPFSLPSLSWAARSLTCISSSLPGPACLLILRICSSSPFQMSRDDHLRNLSQVEPSFSLAFRESHMQQARLPFDRP